MSKSQSVGTPTKAPHPNSLKNLRPPWQSGESGNPSGRPKKKAITEAYERLIAAESMQVAGLPRWAKAKALKSLTNADLVALAMLREAIKGKVQAASEVTDRLEGKARQAIEVSGPDGSPVQIASYRAKLEEVLGIPAATSKSQSKKRTKPGRAVTGIARSKAARVS
jgi:hypothetical protein